MTKIHWKFRRSWFAAVKWFQNINYTNFWFLPKIHDFYHLGWKVLYSSISSVTKLIKNNFSSIENIWLLTWRSLFQSPGSKESICVGKWTYLSLITTKAVHLKNNLTKVHSVKTWHEEILWLIDEMQNNYIKKSFLCRVKTLPLDSSDGRCRRLWDELHMGMRKTASLWME